MKDRPSVVIVSPATAAANNGNWRTAARWATLLADSCKARVVQAWPDADAARDTVMLALHARRSAAAVKAWHASRGSRGLAVVLTGTDLYGDLPNDFASLASIEAASQLVVLQEDGLRVLPQPFRAKARVIYQSTPALPVLPKPVGQLTAVMVGHLREVKSPGTFFDAARLLRGEPGIQLRHIGAAEEPAWAGRAHATERECPGYRWLGALPHERTREEIRAAHVLVHPSAAEGGAHVVMEAVCSGTPVIASRVSGNVGMLGEDYDGYFEHGDAAALARLLRLCHAEDPSTGTLARLGAQCARRAALFAPEAEQAALLRLVQDLEIPP
ncbi:selenoneine biosynthesis selenosugar synthase SenB [Ramlibacter albus]|uniref:TIGR04348 family glycosyltransferase n=1 Tax=Ramlibacter albus TaxID=2079448 RepID=A0A923S4C8_9BURK|nr:selenoneine biosynthesis selenosugar synthase SenB [Ramlibacter albus]MBC5764002.1 TIGR04348 family glycosyltransferase [Ramlibacter albus]